MTVRLYLGNASRLAMGFKTHQRRDHTDKARDLIWIPKSALIVKSRAEDKAWSWPEHIVDVAPWAVEKYNLERFRVDPGTVASDDHPQCAAYGHHFQNGGGAYKVVVYHKCLRCDQPNPELTTP